MCMQIFNLNINFFSKFYWNEIKNAVVVIYDSIVFSSKIIKCIKQFIR